MKALRQGSPYDHNVSILSTAPLFFRFRTNPEVSVTPQLFKAWSLAARQIAGRKRCRHYWHLAETLATERLRHLRRPASRQLRLGPFGWVVFKLFGQIYFDWSLHDESWPKKGRAYTTTEAGWGRARRGRTGPVRSGLVRTGSGHEAETITASLIATYGVFDLLCWSDAARMLRMQHGCADSTMDGLDAA